MRNNTIYIFGNALLECDNMPIKLIFDLQKKFPQLNFKTIDPSENLKFDSEKPIIIDTVKGINRVVLIQNLEQIKSSNVYSLHDFDLGFNLKLMQKIGKISSAKIFGVPQNQPKEKTLSQLEFLIKQELQDKTQL